MIRLHKDPMVYPFVEGTFLLVEKGMASAELQIYTHLYDFREMVFLLHYLRKGDDVFVDVGANVGVYTVLSAGVAGVKVIAMEPAPQTFEKLRRNVVLNGLDRLVELLNLAIGDQEGELFFTANLDAINHVVGADSQEDKIKVPSATLDKLLADKEVTCLKIDVEGFEANVVNGAEDILRRRDLQVVIMETNGLTDQYNFGQSYLHNKLLSFGFKPCDYDPGSRKLISLDRPSDTNTIYIRDQEAAGRRVLEGRKYWIAGREF
ncbi:hypothetical protein GCM10023091_17120 [Ravibacter arvi]|uniref:Methyltransferase FkbM domain-containing protein n=2 Tax=Ravibacter arvi TaxID=2051041 RepID=A0ABP8LXR2_9BACT